MRSELQYLCQWPLPHTWLSMLSGQSSSSFLFFFNVGGGGARGDQIPCSKLLWLETKGKATIVRPGPPILPTFPSPNSCIRSGSRSIEGGSAYTSITTSFEGYINE